MKLNKGLQGLIERASNLHDTLNEEINNSGVNFCNYCSQHGWFCKFSENPFEEREKLIACRDSMRQVEDKLIYFQRLRSWQLISRDSALNRLEERKFILFDKVSQYQGRPLHVINELNACFGYGKTAFDWNLKIKPRVEIENKKRQTKNFLLGCLGFMCNPDRWKKTVETAAKVIVIFLSVSFSLHFYRTRQQICSSEGDVFEYVDSFQAGKAVESMLTISKSRLNVLNGRG